MTDRSDPPSSPVAGGGWRIADIDLDALITTWKCNPNFLGFPKAVLACLYELKEARALLSSPRVEEVRREALEEAAEAADIAGRQFLYSADRYVMQGPAGIVRAMVSAIRALSPPQGE